MSNILINSIAEKKEVESLLNKSIPNYRQAYSDRTSWIMACIAELSYVKFNPIFKNSTKDYFLKKISKLASDNSMKSLKSLIEVVGYDSEEEKKNLKESVESLNLKLITTFDNNGTQAILLENDEYIFLGFRGTESTSIKDIKADAKAVVTVCESGGKIHSGFDEAFNQISVEIQDILDDSNYANKPLFITGHSLGGALATVATKKLTHKGGIAACYTFGSPRVGDEDWTINIKTPVYRVVNAADPVTMLPPGAETIDFFCLAYSFYSSLWNNYKKIFTFQIRWLFSYWRYEIFNRL
jgi:predicted lipase